MIFEIGKHYEHSGGEMIAIVASATTRMWGDTLLAEHRNDGEITAVGKTTDHSVNWHEITAEEFKAGETTVQRAYNNSRLVPVGQVN